MFGTSPFGSQSSASTIAPFGGGQQSGAPAFGSSNPASTGPFSANAPTTSAFGGFGSSAIGATTGAGGFSAFATAPTSFGFGSTTAPLSGGFGAAPPTSPFGTTQGATPAAGFGSAPSSAPSAVGMFGNNSAGFGSSTISTNSANSGFGAFGGPSTTSAITAPAFGSAAPASIFGSTAPRPGGLFGAAPSQPNATSFGSVPNTISGFGSTNASTTTGFGSNVIAAPSFGSTPSTSSFGSASTNPTTFGASTAGSSVGSLFGGATLAPTPGGSFFGSPAPNNAMSQSGTSVVPFQQTTKPDGNSSVMMQTITAMAAYENKSLEELRYEDYMAGNRGKQGQQPSSTAFGGFGTINQGAPNSFGPSVSPTIGGLFGSTSSTATSPFGSGTVSTSSFSASKPLGSSFGVPSTTSAGGGFGSSAPATAGFGSSSPSTSGFGGFGTKPASGTLFGSTQTPSTMSGSLFGSAPASSSATTLFGAPNNASSSGGLFGSPNPASTFGSGGVLSTTPGSAGALFTASSSGSTVGNSFFGASSNPAPTTTGSLFGAPAPSTGTGLFGSANQASQTSGSLFGTQLASTAPLNNTTTASALFSVPANTGGFFSSNPKPASGTLFGGTGLFGSPTPTAASTNLFGNIATNSLSSFVSGSSGASASTSGSSSMFGPTAASVNVQPGMNSTAFPFQQTADALLAYQLAAVENQKKEMVLLEAWRGTTQAGSRVVPYSVSDQSVNASSSYDKSLRITSSFLPFSSPPSSKSAIKIRPRGFGSINPSPLPTTGMKHVGINEPPLLSPNSFIGSSSKTLVIKTKLTPKPRMKLTFGENLTPEIKDTVVNLAQSDEDNTSKVGAGDRTSDVHVRHTPTVSEPLDKSQSHETTHNSTNAPFTSPLLSSSVNIPNGSQPKSGDMMNKSNSHSYDFYQKIISSPLLDVSTYQSPMPVTEVLNTSAPKLSKPGYKVSPSLHTLNLMTDDELSVVSNFKVEREGFGSIAWEGTVDVRGVDLNAVVSIEAQEVAVYSVEEANGSKPKVGSKLNCPAVITISNVYPKVASEEARMKFERKIEKITKNSGAELISYDFKSGLWVFRVSHFSRYGLLHEDNDSDNEETKTSHDDNMLFASRACELKRDIYSMKDDGIGRMRSTYVDASITPTRFGVSVECNDEASECTDENPALYSEEASLKESYADDRIKAADKAYKLFEDNEAFSEGIKDVPSDSGSRKMCCPRYDDEGESSFNFIFPIRRYDLSRGTYAHSICSMVAERCNVKTSKTDFGIRMGRSFRCGWRPDGCLVFPNNTFLCRPFVGKVVSTMRPVFANENPSDADDRNPMCLIATHFKHSLRKKNISDCPSFSLPSVSDNRFFEAVQELRDQVIYNCDEMYSVVGLAFSLLLTVSKWNDIGLERCKEGLVKWFREASSDAVTCTRSKKEQNPLSTIFAALSSSDVSTASSIAINHDYLYLSAILANSSKNSCCDMMKQREIWRDSGTFHLTPSKISLIYDVRTGGSDFLEGDSSVVNSVKNNEIDWKICLGMLLQCCDLLSPNQTIESLLYNLMLKYEKLVSDGNAPLPFTWYNARYSSRIDRERCILYRLLCMISGRENDLARIIHPRSYSPFIHNCTASFYLASIISAMSGLPILTTDEEIFICENYALQLVRGGMWEWAVYVYLCDLSPQSQCLGERRNKAKELVLRHFNESFSQQRLFLQQDVGVPSTWFEDALAFRSMYHFDAASFLQHSSSLEAFLSTAREVYLSRKVFVGGEENCLQILEFFERFAERHGLAPNAWNLPDEFCAAVCRFLALSRSFPKLIHPDEGVQVATDYEALESELRNIGAVFSRLSEHCKRSTRFPGSHSVAEAICLFELNAVTSQMITTLTCLRTCKSIPEKNRNGPVSEEPVAFKVASQLLNMVRRIDFE